MPFLTDNVSVRQVDDEHWKLLEDLVYQGNQETFTVPAGFKTDFASVPRLFTWLIPRYGRYTRAAILHDFLCETAPVSRADADGLFRRIMRELDVPFLRRWTMWAAVRMGAGLQGIKPVSFGQWLLVTVPAVALLLPSALVLLITLVIAWLAEWIVYLPLRIWGRKRVNQPKLTNMA
jgi:hypothetical protein